MSVLVNAARAEIAQAMAARSLSLAWGTGDPAWDTTPVPPDASLTALEAEVGRRLPTTVGYATPDVNGEIQTPSGNYTVSVDPTPHLYVSFRFDYADGDGSTIRETALFVDTTFDGALPQGQMYFLPVDITDAGTMLAVERRPGDDKIVRTSSSREFIEYVITF